MSLRPSSRPSRRLHEVPIRLGSVQNDEKAKSNSAINRICQMLHRFPLAERLENLPWCPQSGSSIGGIYILTFFVLALLVWNASSTQLFSSSLPLIQEGPIHVMTTNYGWDHQDVAIGMSFGRSVRQAELWDGIQSHPSYWADGWRFQKSSRSSIQKDHRYYVFLDVESCFEAQYPNYIQNIGANSDMQNGRYPISSSGGLMPKLRSLCPIVDDVLATPMFQQQSGQNNLKNNTHLVLFDCRPFGPKSCLSRRDNPHLDHRVSLVSLSATIKELSPIFDLGLPPPAITKIQLTATQERNIEACNIDDRPYLLTFVGSFRGSVRSQLKELDDGNDVLILDNLDRLENSNRLNDPNKKNGVVGQRYRQLLSASQFSAVPRGDNLYSYRFAEVLSAGAIPVIIADDWVLPLCFQLVGSGREEEKLLGWNDMAVLIAEREVSSTVDILREISVEKRCEMRRLAYDFHQRYLSSSEATVTGIIECLERRFENKNDK